MRDKIRVKVLLPATQGRFEFRVPFDITVEQGARLISRILASREPSRYQHTDDVDLLLLDGDGAGSLLNPKQTFRGLVLEGVIAEGSEVMLT